MTEAQDPLDVVAGRINAFLDKSDANRQKSADQRLSAALELAKAKVRVEAGEAGEGISWELWCGRNIKRSRGDVRKLLAIAKADDPEHALTEDREKSRQRAAQWRKDQELRVRTRTEPAPAPEPPPSELPLPPGEPKVAKPADLTLDMVADWYRTLDDERASKLRRMLHFVDIDLGREGPKEASKSAKPAKAAKGNAAAEVDVGQCWYISCQEAGRCGAKPNEKCPLRDRRAA